MTDLLEVPSIRRRVNLLSPAEYHRLGDAKVLAEDVELLRGLVIAKMPKSPLHEYVVQQLMMLLIRWLSPEFQVRREGPLALQDSEPEPDLSIVRGSPSDWLVSHPATAQLVVEVAVSSIELDRQKAEIYAEAEIPEYWVVRPEDRELDVYSQPSAQGYRTQRTYGESDTIRSLALPGIALRLSDILPSKQVNRL